MSHEYGIGTRVGGFCAHPYLMRLFHLSTADVQSLREDIIRGDTTRMPGAIRISFGFYNSRADVDNAVEALWNIHNGKWCGEYRQNPHTGEYVPTGTSHTDPAPLLWL